MKIFILAFLLSKILAIEECKYQMMQFFQLEAAQYPNKLNSRICGNMNESCCTPNDELQIWNRWKEFSLKRIRTRNTLLMINIKNIFKYHRQIRNIDPSLIETVKTEIRKVPTTFKVCGRSALQNKDDKKLQNVDLLNNQQVMNSDNINEQILQNVLQDQQDRQLKLDQQQQTVAQNNTEQQKDDQRNLGSSDVPLDFKQELPERKVECEIQEKNILRRIRVHNKKKQNFCNSMHEKIVEFPIEDYEFYLDKIAQENSKMMQLKKSFYCSMCDIKLQRNIDPVNKVITFDQGFCRNLIFQFGDYIKFMNVILVEYVDMLLQYVRCFQSPAGELRYPGQNFLRAYKKRFKDIESCYENLSSPGYMLHCVKICQDFSYTTFDNFFDGNLDIFKRVNMILLSFARKVREDLPLLIDEKYVQKKFMEIDNLDFDSDFYKDARKLHGLLQKYSEEDKEDLEMRSKTLESETEFSAYDDLEDPLEAVYENKKPVQSVKYFRNVFVDEETAINPLHLEDRIDFDGDMRNQLKKDCLDEQNEKVDEYNHKMIKEYFDITEEDIKNFTHDLYLPVTDYSFFEAKKDKPAIV